MREPGGEGYQYLQEVRCIGAGDSWTLTYGSKELELGFGQQGGGLQAATSIETRWPENRIEGETTKLYEEAKRLMQDYANAHQGTVYYRFKTVYSQMARWARTKGNELFSWDFISDADPEELDYDNDFVAMKFFKPQPEEAA